MLGELIALYEHITFVEGGGVGGSIPSISGASSSASSWPRNSPPRPSPGDAGALAEQDSSTKALISYYLNNRAN